VSVVGASGAGKTTVAAALARRLDVPLVELDALFHLPGWQSRPEPEFRALVDRATAGPAWVVDGNYSAVRDLVWARADQVVWLDLPRPVVLAQVLRRSLGRALGGTELWNGNREHWRNLLRRDPERNIVRWSWTRHPLYRRRYAEALAAPGARHLAALRVRARSGTAALLAVTPAPGGTAPAFPERRWGRDDLALARLGRRFVGTPAGSALARRLVPWDRRLLAVTGGGRTVLGPFGVPLLLLTTTGRRTGRPRTTPLVYLSEGDRLLVAASNFGGPAHPAWSENLVARPRATVTLAGLELPVTAAVLDGPARERAWSRFEALGPYGVYRQRTERTIRVFALDRAGPGHEGVPWSSG
jgi:deazaflavin-dependent oxidoreductase (nitroreductase family)